LLDGEEGEFVPAEDGVGRLLGEEGEGEQGGERSETGSTDHEVVLSSFGAMLPVGGKLRKSVKY
jgi:hypothetical protein